MRRVHFCAGLEESNGMAVAARLLAKEQDAPLLDVREAEEGIIHAADEVWVHSCWKPDVWRVCRMALKARKRLVRMLHGNLDPIRLKYHGWKKWLVGLVERHYLRKSSLIVATCEAEREWIQAYIGKRCPKVEVTDMKRFFDLSREEKGNGERGTGNGCREERVERAEEKISSHKEHKEHNGDGKLHLLYLGRRHPLKGLKYIEKAVGECENVKVWKSESVQAANDGQSKVVFRVESNVFGNEKEAVWDWCDVLVLPTLSENFGLVVAEALERGKRVITTDGAPAWENDCKCKIENVKCKIDGGEIWAGYGGRLIFLKGYREGSDEIRVQLLKNAIHILQ